MAESKRSVCQYQFKVRDIVWICRECQKDETCVLCNNCFQNSDHRGHDVFFYHSHSGGCCDCGDSGAWDPRGFCCDHGTSSSNPLEGISDDVIATIVPALDIIANKITTFAESYAAGFDTTKLRSEKEERLRLRIEREREKREQERLLNAEKEKERETIKVNSISSGRISSAASANSSSSVTSFRFNLGDHNHNHEEEKEDEEKEGDEEKEEDNEEEEGEDVSEPIYLASSNSNSTISWADIDDEYDHDNHHHTEDHNDDVVDDDDDDENIVVVLHDDDIHEEGEITAALRNIANLPPPVVESVLERLETDGSAVIRNFPGRRLTTLQKILLASELKDRANLQVCVIPESYIENEREINKILLWLYALAQSSGDGLCRMICNCFEIPLLRRILQADVLLSKIILQSLHNLFLTLMADQSFKMNLAIAYAQAYPKLAQMFGIGIGMVENSILSLSVQFLNRETFVSEIVNHHQFLQSISSTLFKTLEAAVIENRYLSVTDLETFVPAGNIKQYVKTNHHILQCRRYNPILGDFKMVLAIEGMPEKFISHNLQEWLSLLKLYQYMHTQVREEVNHILYEKNDWMMAFNVAIPITSLFESLLQGWIEKSSSASVSSPMSSTDLKAVDIFHQIISTIFEWQTEFGIERKITRIINPCVSDLEDIHLINGPSSYSFHIFLHRFLSVLVLECTKHSHHIETLRIFQANLRSESGQWPLFLGCSLNCLLWSAEIRMGKWARNGHSIQDQLINYATQPFCRLFRDVDLFSVQFLASLSSSKYEFDSFVLQVFNRFDILKYLMHGFSKAEDSNKLQECLHLIVSLASDLPTPPNTGELSLLISMMYMFIQ